MGTNMEGSLYLLEGQSFFLVMAISQISAVTYDLTGHVTAY
jgi:hypothetical protein